MMIGGIELCRSGRYYREEIYIIFMVKLIKGFKVCIVKLNLKGYYFFCRNLLMSCYIDMRDV